MKGSPGAVGLRQLGFGLSWAILQAACAVEGAPVPKAEVPREAPPAATSVPQPSGAEVSVSAKGVCVFPSEDDVAKCLDDEYWRVFRHTELPPREGLEQALMDAIARFPNPSSRPAAALLHFRLGQIRLAMALENSKQSLLLKAGTLISGEFEKAMQYDSHGGIIAPWKDTMDMAMFAVLGDWEQAVPLAERGFANVPMNPMGNTLSLSGTTIGFPLSTNVPQRTVALLDEWVCADVDWCTRNTEHAPYARPGLSFHFAEAYARVGRRETAEAYLNQAATSPGYESWPYRSIVEDARRDLDGFLRKFSSLGNDGSAFDIAYANQPYGCVFCHGAPPGTP